MSLLQSIIGIIEKCSHGGNKDLRSGCCQRHQCQFLLNKSIWKLLLRYTPDHLKFWTKYWSASEPFWRLCIWRFTYPKGNLDWCRRISHFFSLLCGSGREKTSHISLLIICSQHWSLYNLMGIAGFTSLGMPLKLSEPAYLEHVSSVFLFSLRVCERNCPLCIGTLQFLNYSSYWSSGTIQSFFTLDQVKKFILA